MGILCCWRLAMVCSEMLTKRWRVCRRLMARSVSWALEDAAQLLKYCLESVNEWRCDVVWGVVP